MIGKRIAHYEVTAKLGEGGMGEVYRATDTKLNREVALKILPEQFASDSQRMGRFQREAEVLASLDYPNIGAIYGIEDVGETKALVLQLIEGPTLADRIAEGPIPVDEAVPIALQIAEALEAAHEKGIIHRDLKPANIKVTPEGQVKVLDFGLAKAMENDPASSPDMTQSPTQSIAATQAGLILGTAAYMSPEQARGKSVDKRTDIWALGSVFYEMLTGRQAFQGETVSDVLARVLEREPDWQYLPADLFPPTRRLLVRCLKKDSRNRLHDVADVRISLEDLADQSHNELVTPSPMSPRERMVPWCIAAAFAALSGVLFVDSFQRGVEPVLPLEHYEIAMPGVLSVGGSLALSQDGRYIAYTGLGDEGAQVIYARALAQPEVYEVEGTTGGEYQFFSPDSEYLAFHAQGVLWKVSVKGGRREAICETPEAVGGTWGPKGEIVYAVPNDGLYRVSDRGGEPVRITEPPEGTVHVWPHFLPGGESLLFTIWGGSEARPQVAHISLFEGVVRSLLEGSDAVYASTGHLIFHRAGTLVAAPFNAGSGVVSGDVVEVIPKVASIFLGRAYYGIAESGHLVLVEALTQMGESSLVAVDRKGNETPAFGGHEAGVQPQFSPSGSNVAYVSHPTWGLFSLALDAGGRSTPMHLPSDGKVSTWPVWSPDEDWIAFVSLSDTGFNSFRVRSDGSGNAEQLTFERNLRTIPSSWSVGNVLAVEQGPNNQRDILVLPMSEVNEGKLKGFLVGPDNERGAKFSPDGTWLAYTSDRSGLDEVWVVPYPEGGPPVLASIGGGKEPVWSRAGPELFYRNDDQMWVVAYDAKPTFRPGEPRLLFRGDYSYGYIDWAINYDVYPDGQRLLMVKEGPVPNVQVLVNWFEELKRLVPVE